MAVITPAVAGPFDLGTVVVRVALFVNPETAQVNAVSDPIPDVFGGVKLDLRAIEVNLERSKFMRNPTNCSRLRDRRHAERRRLRPDQPGGVQLLPGLGALPGHRLQQARLQAEAVHATARRAQDHTAPSTPSSGRSSKRAKAMPTSAAAR